MTKINKQKMIRVAKKLRNRVLAKHFAGENVLNEVINVLRFFNVCMVPIGQIKKKDFTLLSLAVMNVDIYVDIEVFFDFENGIVYRRQRWDAKYKVISVLDVLPEVKSGQYELRVFEILDLLGLIDAVIYFFEKIEIDEEVKK